MNELAEQLIVDILLQELELDENNSDFLRKYDKPRAPEHFGKLSESEKMDKAVEYEAANIHDLLYQGKSSSPKPKVSKTLFRVRSDKTASSQTPRQAT